MSVTDSCRLPNFVRSFITQTRQGLLQRKQWAINSWKINYFQSFVVLHFFCGSELAYRSASCRSRLTFRPCSFLSFRGVEACLEFGEAYRIGCTSSRLLFCSTSAFFARCAASSHLPPSFCSLHTWFPGRICASWRFLFQNSLKRKSYIHTHL